MERNVDDPPGFFRVGDRIVVLAEWVSTSLFSCFAVGEYGTAYEFRPFETDPNLPFPGDEVDRILTRVHTNLMRSGDSGLPKDWEMLVYGWRAEVSEHLSEEAVRFLDSCSAEFEYNAKSYDRTRLMDLVHVRRPTMDVIWKVNHLAEHELHCIGQEGKVEGPGVLPVHMRENLSFGVRVVSEDGKALQALREGQRKLGRPFFCWIYLDGLLKRLVY